MLTASKQQEIEANCRETLWVAYHELHPCNFTIQELLINQSFYLNNLNLPNLV